MPPLNQAGRIAALSLKGDEPFHVLLTIAHDEIETQRFTNNTESILSNGNLFSPYPFVIELPTGGDNVPTGKLRIANINRRIWRLIEALTTSPIFTIEIVLPSDLDTVIDSYDVIELSRVTGTGQAIEGSLTQTVYIDEPLPSARMTPEYFPWIARV